MRELIAKALALALTSAGIAQTPNPLLTTKPAKSDLIEIQKGTLPIILSCPHDGTQPIPEVPERKGTGIEKFVVVRDSNASLILKECAKVLEKELGGKPWVVIAKFERKYCDANRPKDGAYESDKAKEHYLAYHEFLEDACRTVKEKHKKGLLLDIHGQAKFPDAICRGTNNGKTVTLLKDRFGWPGITGPQGVFGQLGQAGYEVRPGNGTTDKEDAGYNGGYIVQTYGSHTAYAIDAIQLEYGGNLRKKNTVAKTGQDLAAAVKAFQKQYLTD